MLLLIKCVFVHMYEHIYKSNLLKKTEQKNLFPHFSQSFEKFLIRRFLQVSI